MKYILILSVILSCSNPTQFSYEPGAERLSSETDNTLNENENEDEDSELCLDCSDGFVHEFFEFKEEETKLDILFVLDVSRSMRDNLSKLGESMDSLLSRINNFDWQMAFTTADHGDHTKVGGRVGEESWQDYRGDLPHFGQFMRLELRGELLGDQILKKNNPDFDKIFEDTLTSNSTKNCNDGLPPFCQGGHEQPLRSLKAALEREENQLFFRKNADLIIIVITNEDERVEDPRRATSAQEVKDVFYSLNRNKGKSMYGFGIIVNNEDCYIYHNNRMTRGEYSERVAELAQVTSGRNISICEEDYGNALRGVSNLIRKRSFDRVKLEKTPKEGTTQVSFTPRQDIEWVVRGETIFLKSLFHLIPRLMFSIFQNDF